MKKLVLFILLAMSLSVMAELPPPATKTFIINGVELEMVAVKGGTFWRGAQNVDPEFANYDPNASENEMPMHQMTLSDFWISRYVVTQDLWFAVMGMSPNNDLLYYLDDQPYYQVWSNYPSCVGDRFPAFYISYTDMQKFCGKLSDSQKNKIRFDLPTEAQWEYAARGGIYANENLIYAGSNNYNEVAWTSENASDILHEVGLKKPNALGLYDMCGNVAEWCKDNYSSELQSPKFDDYYNQTGYTYVQRGGRFARQAVHNRITTRYDADKNDRQYYYGGRLVITGGLPIDDEPVTPTRINSAEQIAIYAKNGRIFGAENAQIYDLLGNDVTNKNGNLHGIFVVKNASFAQKIIVR